jgi:hypothetical protein
MRIRPLRHVCTFATFAAAAIGAVGCGSDNGVFPQGCQGRLLPGEAIYQNAEVEPSFAVDPKNPAHLLGAWQQDRFSGGGANGILAAVSFDSGNTWTMSSAAFSRCTGGSAANAGNYERASDPWVSISPDGTAHQLALSFDMSSGRRAILASRSADGGRTWSAPAGLQVDTDSSFALDKGSITADPKDVSAVYAVWDRLTQFNVNPPPPTATGPTWFARSIDGGNTWEAARSIYDPGADAQTIGNIVAVTADGTLLNVMLVITCNSNTSCAQHAAIEVVRSADKGVTWSTPPVTVQPTVLTAGVAKANTRIRTGGALPSIAVDASNGVAYAVWEDSFNGGNPPDGIALSRSADGAQSWSAPPIQVNAVHAAQAFTPVVSAGGGRVAVSYYDTRNDNPTDLSHFMVNAWLAVSTDQGATWQETPLAGPFDMRTAPFAEGYFLGDYQGIAWDGTSFLAYFAATTGTAADPTAILFRRGP